MQLTVHVLHCMHVRFSFLTSMSEKHIEMEIPMGTRDLLIHACTHTRTHVRTHAAMHALMVSFTVQAL